MKHTIPTTKIWRQPNIDEYSGELYATKGVDLTSARGKIRPSRSTLEAKGSTDNALLVFPNTFVRTSADNTDRWWALCNTRLFKTTNATTTDFTQDAIASTPSDLSHLTSDAVEFNSALLASRSTDIARLATGTWTTTWWGTTLAQTGMTASIYHPMFVGFQNVLLIGDSRYVHTVDSNDRVRKNRVTLRPEFKIRWIRGNTNSYFIGADHIYGGNGKVFEWDGTSENFNREYDIQSDISFSCAVKQEIPYVFNRNGQLLKYNGGGFSEVARLPIAHTTFSVANEIYGAYLQDAWSDILNVTPNGMDVVDGKVCIALNGGLNGGTINTLDTMPSGIYEYDENIGLYNKYPFSNYKSGSRINFGGNSIYRSGGLKNINNHNFFAGFSTFTNATTDEKHSIITLSPTIATRGSFVTPKIQTPGELQKWQRLWTKHRLKTSDDKIIVKYRTSESINSNFRAVVTWVNTTSFTGLSGVANCVGEGDWSTASIGDEVEITLGHGAGILAHITSIVLSGGDYTITIDETLEAAATTTARVNVRNWKKLGTITHTDDNPISFALNKEGQKLSTSSWIQFKVELRGLYDGCELEEMQIISDTENKGTS